jgi:hypothetical protein
MDRFLELGGNVSGDVPFEWRTEVGAKRHERAIRLLCPRCGAEVIDFCCEWFARMINASWVGLRKCMVKFRVLFATCRHQWLMKSTFCLKSK